jgi:hypothetical protein
VRLQTSVSAADLARLRLTTITGDEVCIAQAIPSGRQHADTMAQLSALYTYASALSPAAPHARRIEIPHGSVVPALPERNPGKRPWGIHTLSVGGRPVLAAMVAVPARSSGLP